MFQDRTVPLSPYKNRREVSGSRGRGCSPWVPVVEEGSSVRLVPVSVG